MCVKESSQACCVKVTPSGIAAANVIVLLLWAISCAIWSNCMVSAKAPTTVESRARHLRVRLVV